MSEDLTRALERRAGALSVDTAALREGAIRTGVRRRARRRVVRAGSAVVALAVVIGGGVLVTRPDPTPVVPAGGVDGPVIRLGQEWTYPPGGSIDATLERQGDCLLLDGKVAIWPAGSTWDAADQSVSWDGRTYRVGDRVAGAAGTAGLSADLAWAVDDDAGHAVAQCASAAGPLPRIAFVFPGVTPGTGLDDGCSPTAVAVPEPIEPVVQGGYPPSTPAIIVAHGREQFGGLSVPPMLDGLANQAASGNRVSGSAFFSAGDVAGRTVDAVLDEGGLALSFLDEARTGDITKHTPNRSRTMSVGPYPAVLTHDLHTDPDHEAPHTVVWDAPSGSFELSGIRPPGELVALARSLVCD